MFNSLNDVTVRQSDIQSVFAAKFDQCFMKCSALFLYTKPLKCPNDHRMKDENKTTKQNKTKQVEGGGGEEGGRGKEKVEGF